MGAHLANARNIPGMMIAGSVAWRALAPIDLMVGTGKVLLQLKVISALALVKETPPEISRRTPRASRQFELTKL